MFIPPEGLSLNPTQPPTQHQTHREAPSSGNYILHFKLLKDLSVIQLRVKVGVILLSIRHSSQTNNPEESLISWYHTPTCVGVCCSCLLTTTSRRRTKMPVRKSNKSDFLSTNSLSILYLWSWTTTWCWGWSCSRRWWTCRGSCSPACKDTKKTRTGFCYWAGIKKEKLAGKLRKWNCTGWRPTRHSHTTQSKFSFIYWLQRWSAVHAVGHLPLSIHGGFAYFSFRSVDLFALRPHSWSTSGKDL